MATLTDQARDLRSEIDRDTAGAKTLWTTFDALRKSAASEGVDFATNTDAFTKLDDAGRAYDAARDAIAAKEARWARLVEMAGDSAPQLIPTPREAPDAKNLADRYDLGARFVKSAAYAESRERLGRAADQPFGVSKTAELLDRTEVKTLLTSSGVAALYRNDKLDLTVPLPTAPLNLLDVIASGTTDSDTVEYQLESTWTNSAAETAEGSAAPESAIAYTTATTLVQDITHFIPATKRALADAGQAESLINNRLIRGVRNRLQSQIVSGNGTAPNLRGITNVAGILTQALSTDSRADAVHKAMTKIRIQGEGDYTPGFIGMHPTDWESCRLEKNVNGAYYFGGPAANADVTLWGLAPVVSTVFSQGTPVVFDAGVMQLWFNGGLEVSMGDQHDVYFTAKKVAVMASLRAAFAVWAPKGVCTVTGF